VPVDVLVRRSPFGVPNHTPLNDRGWIYLERFISMVKVAMVDETEANRVVFSNSPDVLAQIYEGGNELRSAAQTGQQCLDETLHRFLQSLETKTFGGSSTDKLVDEELGHSIGLGRRSIAPGSEDLQGDRAVVAGIMQRMVEDLPSHWAAETTRQRQRQFEMAVNRGDAKACAELLAAGADVNKERNGSTTSLHVAAKHLDLPVAKVLLQFHADCGAQDAYGDTPAHWVPLFDREETLHLFDLLTPSLEVLSKENAASISPFERYATWAQIAQENSPYPPAQEQVDELRRRFPSLAFEEIEKKKAASRKANRDRLPVSSSGYSRTTQQCHARGREISLVVWEPMEGEVFVTVLWTFAVGAHGAWALNQPGYDFLARHVCGSQGVRLMVLPLHQCFQLTPSASWSTFCEEAAAVIEALPLPQKFVLAQEGASTSLCWRLQHRLAGFLTVSSCAVFDEEYLNSDAFRSWVKFMNMNIQSVERRDAHSLATRFMRNVTANITPELVTSWEAECAKFTAEEWDFLGFQFRCAAAGEYTDEVKDRAPLAPTVPGAVAISAKGAKVCTQYSCFLMSNLLSDPAVGNCEIAFLPQSSRAWALEGEDTRVDVTLLLADLIRRVLRDVSSSDRKPFSD